MEISRKTRMNIVGLLIGIIAVISDHIHVYGQTRHRHREGTVRLVGGRTRNEGTVVIYHWSRWGSICDDYWDIRDANVVCSQLGFPGALEAPRRSTFGRGRRRVWLSGLHCRGNERHITMCISRGWGNYLRRCRSYWSAAGVVCKPKRERRPRLRHRTPKPKSTSTTSTTLTTTTVKTIQIAKQTPVITLSNISSQFQANSMLRSLPTAGSRLVLQSERTDKAQGLETETSAPAPVPAPAPIQILRDDPSATLDQQLDKVTEKTSRKPPMELVKDMTEKETGKTNNDLGADETTDVQLSGEAMTSKPSKTVPTTAKPSSTVLLTSTTTKTTSTMTSPTTSTTTKTTSTTTSPTTSTTTKTTSTTTSPTTSTSTTSTTTSPTTTTRRVYNRWVYNREMWRYYMYFRDGRVVTSRPDPRYYRYRSTSTTTTPTPTTHTTTTSRPAPVRNQVLNEVENSEEIHRHRHRKPGYVGDQPQKDTAINEIPEKPVAVEEDAPGYTDFRVVGGRKYSSFIEGRLEIRLAGSNKWGVMCGDDWDMRAAIVLCRHMGIGYARTAHKTDYYGGSNMDKVVSTLRCTGREDRLEDCVLERVGRTPGKATCSKPQSVAGVICETRLPDLEPDVEALQYSLYLQDRYNYYLTCAFEEKCLSSSANDLYGTQRWNYARRRLLRFSTIAINKGTADFRPNIDRSQWEWHECHMHFHSMEAFSHYDLIDTHGNKLAEGQKASFCLEDSQCDRGVFPKYNCVRNGEQGISVGCRDSYLHDIDCQWIDVTDVKPGSYTLKVELNPGLLVAETSFDNNVAICSIRISSTDVRASSCKLGSLL